MQVNFHFIKVASNLQSYQVKEACGENNSGWQHEEKKKKNIKDVVEIDVHMGLLCMEEIIRCGCERQQIMEDILMLKRKCA